MGVLINILKVFNIPLVRHVVAGIGIIIAIYYLAINPLQQQNKEIREDYRSLVDTQAKIIDYLAKKDTYHIENKVDAKKLKDGSNINLVPNNNLQVDNSKIDSLDNRVDSLPLKKKNFFRKTWDYIKFW